MSAKPGTSEASVGVSSVYLKIGEEGEHYERGGNVATVMVI